MRPPPREEGRIIIKPVSIAPWSAGIQRQEGKLRVRQLDDKSWKQKVKNGKYVVDEKRRREESDR